MTTGSNAQTLTTPPTDTPPGMVWLPGGTFVMGSDSHYPEEAPAHRVTVSPFWLDTFAVTNALFASFVAGTGYVTVAEQAPDAADYPGAAEDMLVPGSTVFIKPAHRVDLSNPYNWWSYVPGAQWRHPQGPASSLAGIENHPVVHIAWEDVRAYAAWAGKALPTEAEWEFAARGGLDGAEYAWGAELSPGGQWMANTWQGEFPIQNTMDDGFEGTAPNGSFPANGYGLSDMIGNVWEWTADWFGRHEATAHACCSTSNAAGRPGGSPGRSSGDSVDPAEGLSIPRKVTKGGSHLCSPNYCRRYRPAARMPQHVDTATSHLGFRCVLRPTA